MADVELPSAWAASYRGVSRRALIDAQKRGLRCARYVNADGVAWVTYRTNALDAFPFKPPRPSPEKQALTLRNYQAWLAKEDEKLTLREAKREARQSAERGEEERARAEDDRRAAEERTREASHERELREEAQRITEERETAYHAAWMDTHEALHALGVGYSELNALVDSGDVLKAGDEVVPRRKVVGHDLAGRAELHEGPTINYENRHYRRETVMAARDGIALVQQMRPQADARQIVHEVVAYHGDALARAKARLVEQAKKYGYKL